MDNNLLLLIMAALFVLSIILILLIVLNNAKKTNDLNNELSKSIYEIRNTLNKDFVDFNRSINGEFNSFSERVNSNLIKSYKSTNEVFKDLSEKMIRIDETQKSLNDLSEDIISLQNVLTDKKSRGSFGEIELYSLLESAYGDNRDLFDKQFKLPNGSIADAVVFGTETMGLICIDSKFPLENYRRIYDFDLDEKTRETARKQFRDDVKKHIDDISRKYIIDGITADMAYMFIPSEAVFAEIYGKYQEVIDYSYEKKV
jgi:DNA recombination protein RmuC